MRKFPLILLVLAAFACGKKADSTESLSEETGSYISQTVSANEFLQKVGSTPGAVLIDVRTPAELQGGYIDGAINIDFRSSDFEAKISALDRDTPYLLYCGSGIRSRKAADVMKQLKFKEVYEMEGGFASWKENALPVKQP